MKVLFSIFAICLSFSSFAYESYDHLNPIALANDILKTCPSEAAEILGHESEGVREIIGGWRNASPQFDGSFWQSHVFHIATIKNYMRGRYDLDSISESDFLSLSAVSITQLDGSKTIECKISEGKK